MNTCNNLCENLCEHPARVDLGSVMEWKILEALKRGKEICVFSMDTDCGTEVEGEGMVKGGGIVKGERTVKGEGMVKGVVVRKLKLNSRGELSYEDGKNTKLFSEKRGWYLERVVLEEIEESIISRGNFRESEDFDGRKSGLSDEEYAIEIEARRLLHDVFGVLSDFVSLEEGLMGDIAECPVGMRYSVEFVIDLLRKHAIKIDAKFNPFSGQLIIEAEFSHKKLSKQFADILNEPVFRGIVNHEKQIFVAFVGWTENKVANLAKSKNLNIRYLNGGGGNAGIAGSGAGSGAGNAGGYSKWRYTLPNPNKPFKP